MHLIKILEIKHLDSEGNVLWQEENIPNIFHRQGEQFLLSVAFNTASTIVVPANYYIGLDGRLTLSDTDTLLSLANEPNTNGYSRAAVPSLNGFSVSLDVNNKFSAVSNVVQFSASGGSWGPVQNLFLCNTITNSGFLISCAKRE